MKRLLMVCVAIVSIFAIGCEKEDAGLDKRLVGTKWACAYYDAYDIYEFTSVSKVQNYMIEDGIVTDHDGTFDYVLDYPYLYIYRINSSGERYALEFIFENGHKFIRTEETWLGLLDEYTKQ